MTTVIILILLFITGHFIIGGTINWGIKRLRKKVLKGNLSKKQLTALSKNFQNLPTFLVFFWVPNLLRMKKVAAEIEKISQLCEMKISEIETRDTF